MISGEINPKSPDWLKKQYQVLRQLGYNPASESDNPEDQYSKGTEAVGLTYLKEYLTEPGKALSGIGDYLKRFGEVNKSAGILSRVTPDQFGMIINIASLGYNTFDRQRLLILHTESHDYLKGENSADIPAFTAQLRKPELLRDMVAHWSSIYWPNTTSYTTFLTNNTAWDRVKQQVELRENNPILFGLTVPEAPTDPLIRHQFKDEYPELTQQGIDIIAAGLFNRGAHSEVLRENATPQFEQWYKERYKNWEDTIREGITRYAPGYRPDILQAITEARWNIFPEVKVLATPKIMDKISRTSFSLDAEGEFVRKTTPAT